MKRFCIAILVLLSLVILVMVSCKKEETLEEYAIAITYDQRYGTVESNVAKAEAGTEITLTATPINGYLFQFWVIESGGSLLDDGAVNPVTFLMPENDVEIRAEFIERVYYTDPVAVSAGTGGSASANVTGGLTWATSSL